MIKLKNLWKVALATMAMSAMLVACDTTSTDEKESDSMAKYKTKPVLAKAESFTYGFKFCTEEGWDCHYTSAGAVAAAEQAENVYAKLNGAPVNMAKDPINKVTGDTLNDASTKIYVDKAELESAKMYTITYDKKNGTVKLTDAAAGAKATSTTAQKVNAEGNYPAGIYIAGYLGGNWPADNNAKDALLMDVVDAANEVYSFTWVAPATTITVTLKITMEDTKSTLYLRDVPVKNDGTSSIDGSIYSWNGGSAVTIKNEDGSPITGGIFDAAMTAKTNASFALENIAKQVPDGDLAKDFNMPGADDVLQLSIDAEKFVPYVKGKEVTFSWANGLVKK